MADRNIPGGDSSFASVVLLTHFDGANNATTFTEQTGKTLTATDGAKLSTTSPKFGTASLVLDGAGDYVTTPGVSDFVFGSGDFTVEAWIKTSTTREQLIVDFYVPLQLTWQLELNSSGRLNFYGSNGSSNGAIATGTSILTNGAWHHVAVSRASGTTRLFVDGALEATASDSRNYSYTASFLAIGAQVTTRNSSYDFPGNIDDVRITKGVARYTAAFTAPGLPFPDSGVVVVAQTLDGVTQSAASAAIVKAASTATLATVTQSATATVSSGTVSASAAQTLAGVSQSATAKTIVSASASQTLQGVAQAATATATEQFSGSQTLASVTQAATATVTAIPTFSAAQTLDAVAQQATGVARVSGGAAQALSGVTSTATGSITVGVSATQALAGVDSSAAGSVVVATQGAQALDGVAQTATATVAETVRAFVAAQVLAAVSQNARLRHRYVFERNERTVDVRAESRVFAVAAEDRSFEVAPESRGIAIAGEDRRIAFTD